LYSFGQRESGYLHPRKGISDPGNKVLNNSVFINGRYYTRKISPSVSVQLGRRLKEPQQPAQIVGTEFNSESFQGFGKIEMKSERDYNHLSRPVLETRWDFEGKTPSVLSTYLDDVCSVCEADTEKLEYNKFSSATESVTVERDSGEFEDDEFIDVVM